MLEIRRKTNQVLNKNIIFFRPALFRGQTKNTNLELEGTKKSLPWNLEILNTDHDGLENQNKALVDELENIS